MLELVSSESRIKLDCSGKPEFDSWTWVDYWHPVEDVVYFKRDVYQRALTELSGHIGGDRTLNADLSALAMMGGAKV